MSSFLDVPVQSAQVVVPLPLPSIGALPVFADKRPGVDGILGDVFVGAGTDGLELTARAVVILVGQEGRQGVILGRWSVILVAGKRKRLLVGTATVNLSGGAHDIVTGGGIFEVDLGYWTGYSSQWTIRVVARD